MITGRKSFTYCCASGLCLLLGALAVQAESPAPRNVVVMVADDLGWRDLGCQGSRFYETPRLDQLARQGARFKQAYSACPVCSPTRASLMTGKYPARLATTDYFGGPQPDGVAKHWTANKPLLPAPYENKLPLEEVTPAEALKQAGYATFYAGKWHLGGEGYLPEQQGFDVNIPGTPGKHEPMLLAESAATFIESHKAQNFYVHIGFTSPHIPLQAPDDLIAKYEEKAKALPEREPEWPEARTGRVRTVQDHPVYAAMVEHMDAAVGVVLDAIEQAGLAESTLVIFTSDNGGLSTAEGHPTSNLPLRAGKGWLYEGGIRVPLIVRWPGAFESREGLDAPVFSGDIYPTLLDWAGLPLRPEQHLDGQSFGPLLRGETKAGHDELFWHYPHYGNQGGTPSAAIRQGDWKLIRHFEDKPIELYNLASDPEESKNLVAIEFERSIEMSARLAAWQKEVGARNPTPNPAAAQTP